MKKEEFEQAMLLRIKKKKEDAKLREKELKKMVKKAKPKKMKVVIEETEEQELASEAESAAAATSGNACDDDSSEVQQPSEDIKLGEIQLRPDSVLVVKKTNYNGSDRVDFRVWKNSATYKGPTKQGFVVTMEKLEEFFKIVDGMKKKLGI
jgi:hypothetical protein